jgi:hypothetical protein
MEGADVGVAPDEVAGGVAETGAVADEEPVGTVVGVADGVGLVVLVFWPPTTPPTVVPVPGRLVTIACSVLPTDSSITVITAKATRNVATVIAVRITQRGRFVLPSLLTVAPATAVLPAAAAPAAVRPAAAAPAAVLPAAAPATAPAAAAAAAVSAGPSGDRPAVAP